MADEEKIIEIDITLDKPYIIVILLAIILIEAGYIGYLQLFKSSVVNNTNIDLEKPVNEFELNATKEVFTNFTEPETFKELKAGLISAGVENIIVLDVQDWQGNHLEANYTAALKLAKEAAFVCVNENIVAFMIYLDGEFFIWFSS